MGEGVAPGGLTPALRALPSVDALARELAGGVSPGRREIAAARAAIERRRRELAHGADGLSPAAPPSVDLAAAARAELAQRAQPSLRPVINATGVIVHTNLGRAPLAARAREAVWRAAHGYSNLELDLGTGERGSRQAHVERALCELTGAPAALVVNNCAAAVLLAVSSICGPARAVVVSRGQLVEIGGSFRIPEVVAASGTRLVEVGTTNRTRRADYEVALGDPDVAAILRVHPSNFATVGFVEATPLEELVALGLPVIDDVGSGVISAGPAVLASEPAVRSSLNAGATLVCCSGDKLLGGPQAGLLLGAETALAAARSHPLARALRIDKLSLAALEATLAIHLAGDAPDDIPVLAMLTAQREKLDRRLEVLRGALGALGEIPAEVSVVECSGVAGGGSLPLLELAGPGLAIAPANMGASELAAALRRADPPVLARVADGAVVLDPRTLTDEQVEYVAAAVTQALAS